MFETTITTLDEHLLPKTDKPPWGFCALKIMIAVLWVVFGMALVFAVFFDRAEPRDCAGAGTSQRVGGSNFTQCI